MGGEFPVPVLQGGGNAGAVTIQFREFGIRLTFNPVVTENGTIKMYVKPEVSTIDLANAVTVSGFLIPALATRRMETNVELGPGQSFVIGGLIDDRVQDSMNKIPGLASIPLLGNLFKSREERKNRTELMVMVTPEVTKPLEAGRAGSDSRDASRSSWCPWLRRRNGHLRIRKTNRSSKRRKKDDSRRKSKASSRGRAKWELADPQITALMISPNRRIAEEFLESLGRGRAFEILADLRAYPTV